MRYTMDKKAEIEEVIRNLLWIAFFVLLIGTVYYLIKSLTGM